MLSKLLLFRKMMLKPKVRIPIRHRNILMTNQLLRILQTHTRQNKVRTKRIPKIMKMKILYHSNTKNPPPILIETFNRSVIYRNENLLAVTKPHDIDVNPSHTIDIANILLINLEYNKFNFDEFVKSLRSCHCERSEAISINLSR